MREESQNEPANDARSAPANSRSSPTVPTATEWLTIDSHDRIETLLRECGVCQSDEKVTKISRAGEGNMNLTLRVRTTAQTVIVKQSRPWVEKYPQIAAPVERILQELRFYETVAAHPELAERMPQLLGSFPDQYVMILQCLGKANDASALYLQNNAIEAFTKLLPDLLDWLGRLHQLKIPAEQFDEFANRELRALNHQHIFVIPFAQEPAIDLDILAPGLAKVANKLAMQESLLKKLDRLGEIYLADHQHLIHGDFFPGSWLLCEGEVRIIDPEFSHGGLPEFDLGVLLAHGTFLAAGQPTHLFDSIRSLYLSNAHEVDWPLVEDFAAVEILRRLLGVAQLPLNLDPTEKIQLVQQAVAQLVG